jgi:uncharacterized protein DUF4397
MSRKAIWRYLSGGAVALAVLFVAAPVGPAGAAPISNEAFVRGAHFSPDTAAVDVYLSAFSGGTSALWLSSVSYGDVSGYRSITPGVYAVSMRPHGAAASTAPVLTWTVNIAPGSAYTAAAIGTNGQLRGIVLPDSLHDPAPGTGMVRIIQASSQAGQVSVSAVNGPVLTSDTGYGAASTYVAVPSGHWLLNVASSSDPSLTEQASVSVASASVTSVVVLDKAGGGLDVRTVLDASGAGTIPNGSVNAGGGGTAPRPQSSVYSVLSIAAFGGAALVAVVGVSRQRRRRAQRP